MPAPFVHDPVIARSQLWPEGELIQTDIPVITAYTALPGRSHMVTSGHAIDLRSHRCDLKHLSNVMICDFCFSQLWQQSQTIGTVTNAIDHASHSNAGGIGTIFSTMRMLYCRLQYWIQCVDQVSATRQRLAITPNTTARVYHSQAECPWSAIEQSRLCTEAAQRTCVAERKAQRQLEPQETTQRKQTKPNPAPYCNTTGTRSSGAKADSRCSCVGTQLHRWCSCMSHLCRALP